MDSSVIYELGNLVDIGLKLLFYITLFSFTLYTVFLGYHWFSYGTDRHTSTLSLAVYLIGAAPLLISMAPPSIEHMLFEKIKLEEDEQMLLVVRRHWFVFLTKIVGVLVTAIAPIFIVTGLSLSAFTAPYTDFAFSNYGNEIWFVASLWFLIHWMILAYLWTDQYLDLWVVTDRRIIAIDQRRLFVRNIGSFRLERLQDMNIEIPGFLATVFDYGSIEAQTASGSEDEFSARFLPKPREIKSVILEAADLRMREMSGFERRIET